MSILADGGSFRNREINIRMDSSNIFVAGQMENNLYDIYERFSKKLMVACRRPKKLDKIPMVFKPLFGNFDTSYQQFLAPGILLL